MDNIIPWMILILLMTESSYQQTIQKTRTCVKGYDTRTFSSLQDYQGTRISFDPGHVGFKGNLVNFSFDSIDRLVKNTFISFGSNSIYTISLDHKHIQYIEDGAFLELFCLHVLDLSYNNLTFLPKDAFEGLSNLRELRLNHNQLKEVPDLKKLYHIRSLDVSSNIIKSLPQLPALSELDSLNLSHNKIRDIKKNTFSNLTSLSQLILSNNDLIGIIPGQWEGLQNLRHLDLAANYLRSFDTSNSFSFFDLTSLNLSGNHLTSLNVFYLKRHLPKLTGLDITKNDWYCDDMEVIKRDLRDTKVILAAPINCSEVKLISVPSASTTSTSTTSKSISPVETTKVHDHTEDILRQNKLILSSNKNIEARLDRIDNYLYFIFIVISVFIAAETLNRCGICDRLLALIFRNNAVDDSERLLLR